MSAVPSVRPPIQCGPVILGFVPAIHGDDGKPCDGFVPTAYELRCLARDWFHEVFAVDLQWFLLGSTGSYEIRIRPYPVGRLKQIAEQIGDDERARARGEVEAEVQERLGPKLWSIFSTFDEAEWNRRRDEINEEIRRGQE
jgi:hypothetical protein